VQQWWSPYVAVGVMTQEFEAIRQEWIEQDRTFELICNEAYTQRVAEVVDSARGNSSQTNEPAYRFLQMLTHLRGHKPVL
jgi:hypothetical protein